MSANATVPLDDCGRIHRRLEDAVQRHDMDRARRIYFSLILPNPAFDRRETERLSYLVGAVDEGDRYLASRADL